LLSILFRESKKSGTWDDSLYSFTVCCQKYLARRLAVESAKEISKKASILFYILQRKKMKKFIAAAIIMSSILLAGCQQTPSTTT